MLNQGSSLFVIQSITEKNSSIVSIQQWGLHCAIHNNFGTAKAFEFSPM